MSRSSDSEGYEALREACAWSPAPPTSCLVFTGADVLEWLHGQLTQHLSELRPGEFREACRCSATGHILSVLTVASLGERVLVTLPSDTSSAFVERVESTVFLEEVTATSAPEAWIPFRICGPTTRQALAQLGISPEHEVYEIPEGRGFVQPFATDVEGISVWASPRDPLIQELQQKLPRASEAAWDAWRIERGLPEWGKDIPLKTLPPELGEPFLRRTVSYAKGCYTGQEVLMRIHSRGHTNRAWTALLCEELVQPGAEVASGHREKAGFVTSASTSPEYGPIAAALLHRQAALPGTKVEVFADGHRVMAEVREMPLRA